MLPYETLHDQYHYMQLNFLKKKLNLLRILKNDKGWKPKLSQSKDTDNMCDQEHGDHSRNPNIRQQELLSANHGRGGEERPIQRNKSILQRRNGRERTVLSLSL